MRQRPKARLDCVIFKMSWLEFNLKKLVLKNYLQRNTAPWLKAGSPTAGTASNGFGITPQPVPITLTIKIKKKN